MATLREIGVISLVIITFGTITDTVVGHSYSCQQPCDTSTCSPTNCKGGLVDDLCGCCKVCARLVNETCGGIDNLFGICDEGLYCAVQPPPHGDPITGNEMAMGTCQQKPDNLKPCHGCNIENMECVCDTSVKACTNPYQFGDKRECRKALSQLGVPIPACPNALCPPVRIPNCPDDSHPSVGGTIQPGDCCPTPPECVCDFSICIDVMCAEGYEKKLLHAGTGQPGRCCDVFECSKKESQINCSTLVCIKPKPILCQVGSRMVPGGISENGCCLLPPRCECVAEECQPVICEPGFETRRIARATGEPGSCCDVYECVNKTTSDWCLYKGSIYEDGASWTTDMCLHCECRSGISHCQSLPECNQGEQTTPAVSQLCVGEGRFYSHGQIWNRDECTVCRCNNGEVQCTATSCAVSCLNPIKIPGRCCPYCEEPTFITFPPPTCPPLTCTLHCEHGHQTDIKGCPLCSCKESACEELRDCNKDCPHGYKTDRNGCEICKCRQLRNCPSMDSCNKRCTYGYQRNKHGCHKCKCEKCPAFICDKECTYGFETNDNGCILCKCKAAPTQPTVSVIPKRSCSLGNGQYHDNGESWHDGCRNCFCHNGQEMCQLISCPIPICNNPEIRPGDCCPSCPDSESSGQETNVKVCHSSDGEYYVEGETWNIDSCTLCLCYDGHVLCAPMTCPPVPCDNPVSKAGSCCPICPEVTTTDQLQPVNCISIYGVEHLHEDTWKEDDCTSCMCRYGEITCYSHVCPLVQCKTPVLKKGQCCPTCLDSSRQKYCEYENQIYTDGERWNASACIHCYCQDGKSVCQKPECPVLRCIDKALIPGECCPRCIDETPLYPVPVKGSTPVPKETRMSPTAHEVISTSRSTSRPHITDIRDKTKTQRNEVFMTEDPFLSTTTDEKATSTEGNVFLPIVLPILCAVALTCLLVIGILCVRHRRKSSEWQKTTKPELPPTPLCKAKNMDLKNSNSIYNSAAKKVSNVYVDPSKLNYDIESVRYSGMYSMGNNKLGQQL
ncbi:cysteine-rich motor neuron 1 protein-like isoform X2 [Ptychodera flava]|uniref:cysteine-rich motor neuron 1 protein-like isoform X2 n=1 Tax=Ptychodera flava TaxID=63121 RepID=UPI003969E6B1